MHVPTGYDAIRRALVLLINAPLTDRSSPDPTIVQQHIDTAIREIVYHPGWDWYCFRRQERGLMLVRE